MYRLFYATKEVVPAELAEFAKEVTEDGDKKGQWSVKLWPDAKVAEMRDSNIAVLKAKDTSEALLKKVATVTGVKVEELNEKLDGFATELTGLRSTQQQVNDGKLQKKDDIEQEVLKRTTAMREGHANELAEKQREIAASVTKATDFEGKYKRTFIDRAVMSAVQDEKLGVSPTAVDDIIQQAYGVFQVQENGELKALKGDQVIYGEDAMTPMSVPEWINTHLRKSKPHYYKKSAGGGAEGGNGEVSLGGLSQADFDKLSPLEKLRFANKQADAQRASKGK